MMVVMVVLGSRPTVRVPAPDAFISLLRVDSMK